METQYEHHLVNCQESLNSREGMHRDLQRLIAPATLEKKTDEARAL